MRVDSSSAFRRVEWQSELEEHVLQAHDTEADWAPCVVGDAGFFGGVEVDVDDSVEEWHCRADHMAELVKVKPPPWGALGSSDEAAQVDRTKVADGGLFLAGDLEDLGAQVGQVHDSRGLASLWRNAGLVALGVGCVLEGHPAVAGLGQSAHHPAVQIAGRNLLLVDASLFGFDVGTFELGAVHVDEVGDLLGVE